MIEINFQVAGKPFQLSHDGFQFVVSEKPTTNKKTGVIKWSVNHFYRTLPGVAQYLVERGLLFSDAETLQELGEEIKRSEAAILAALGEGK